MVVRRRRRLFRRRRCLSTPLSTSHVILAAVGSTRQKKFFTCLPTRGQRTRDNARGARRTRHLTLAALSVRLTCASVGSAQGDYVAQQKRKKHMAKRRIKALPVRRTKSGQTVRTRDKKKSVWR
jgi:hypothetical protein